MTCTVSGVLRNLKGEALPFANLTLVRRGSVVAQDGATVIPNLVDGIRADETGTVTFDAFPGTYEARIFSNFGASGPFRVGVPDEDDADLADLIEQFPPITPSVLALVEEARDETLEAAEAAVAANRGLWAFPTRAAVSAWIAANPTPPVGTVLRWGGIGVRYIGSGTAIADMPGFVPEGDDNPAIHGAPLSGNASVQIEAALDSAVVNVGVEENYEIGSQLSPAAGKVIDGRASGGVTRQALATAGPHYVVRPENNLTFRNIELSAQPMVGSTNGVALLNLGNAVGSVVLDGVTSDFGITVDPSTGARNATSYLALMSDSSDVDGLEIKDSKFTRSFWGFLQANTTTATVKNVSITNSSFDEFGSTYLVFNSPAVGSINENILIAFNDMGSVRSRQPFGSSVGFPHRGSFAGNVEYTRLIGNHAFGYGGEFFRAEEAAKASVWIANTAKLDGKDGIEIIANNIGGTVKTPTLFSVSNNVLENTGLVSAPSLGWGIGLHVYTSVSGLADAECIGESTVHDNISKGWAQALQVHQGSQRNLIHHNVLAGSDEGIRTWAPSLGMQENLISDCPVAVYAERGGLIGRFHLRSADAVPDPSAVTLIEGPLSTEGWTWETGRHAVANGNTDYRIIDLGNRIDGQITVIVSDDTGDHYCHERGRLTYDGTTLIYQRISRYSSGNVLLSPTAPFGIDTSDFAFRITNGTGGAANNIRIQVAFDGLHIWGA